MKKFLLRIPEDLDRLVKKMADKEYRSKTQTYRMIIETYFQERGGLK